MSTYVIGDVQGCYHPLIELLDRINFDSSHDKLWFTGDLVNRGPQSLETLRFIKSLGDNQITVLGNHDLHLLALAYGHATIRPEDTLTPILKAADRDELINWLCAQPLIHHDDTLGYTMVHAGLAYNWDLQTALNLAHEVEMVLQSDSKTDYFNTMYGNQPDNWNKDLKGYDRLRCITNYFTRLRFCYVDGRMDLSTKHSVNDEKSLLPWFRIPHRINKDLKIIFGHWAALEGITNTPNTYALDTGCVWGKCLTAMCLETEKRFSVTCNNV